MADSLDTIGLTAWLRDLSVYLDAEHGGRDALDAARAALEGVPAPVAPREAPHTSDVVETWLADALHRATAADAALAPLAMGFARLAPALRWYRRPTDEPDPAFEQGHANAIVIGGAGRATLGTMIVGVSLLAPGVAYPVHRHPPDEVYVVMSDGEWWRDGTAWWAPGPGALVHNRGGELHAMRAAATPLFAVWFLTGTTAGAGR
ncbi:dimethylsulfonioproprionate lyase family protein [Burkholderia perseverans]|uniref:dimethylsulfonioproprionate lyase family protein n=1 Tax=Burkholderia perseverans TaxID=2615214 RepID=UPI001FEE8747|nr:dimethylsulfonioproprionate lyase family protein [Burkholderia perseverans]